MGDVRQLWIEGPAGKLECALRGAESARAAAVLAHPHPQYGGTLNNPVMFHTDRELNRAGLVTLRFNFRGVGTSEGIHDGQNEVEDVAAAVRWLGGATPGLPLVLVGYSFGSWCSIRHAGRDPAVAALIAIGLPVRKYTFEALATFDRPLAVVQGTLDEFGGPNEVREALLPLRPDADVRAVEGAEHLFPERARDAALAVTAAFEALWREMAKS